MAMITCPECRKKISEAADSCPKCGYKLTPEKVAEIKKKELRSLGIGCLIIIVVAIIIAIASHFGAFSSSKTTKSSVPKSKEETRRERIEKSFSVWDGSHRRLTKVIKESMNDPKSYEHVKTVYWDKGDHLLVNTTFRGKNALGGVVVNWVEAKVDLNGNVTEIISQGP